MPSGTGAGKALEEYSDALGSSLDSVERVNSDSTARGWVYSQKTGKAMTETDGVEVRNGAAPQSRDPISSKNNLGSGGVEEGRSASGSRSNSHERSSASVGNVYLSVWDILE